MASLRLENFEVSLVSKASTSSLGALNSTNSISALVLVSFLGNTGFLSLLPTFGGTDCLPTDREARNYIVVILFKMLRKELLGKSSRAFLYFF